MPYEFNQDEPEPQTQPSADRSGGPPRKHTAVDVLDSQEQPSASVKPWTIRFTGLVIVGVLVIMLAVLFLLNR